VSKHSCDIIGIESMRRNEEMNDRNNLIR